MNSIICAIVAALVLTGCAQTTFQGVCALKILGKDERGYVVAQTYCEAAE